MVKQGKYAGASRNKRLRNLKKRVAKTGRSQTIDRQQLPHFLLVRWQLTHGQQPSVVAITVQHFLQGWLAAGDAAQATWSLKAVTQQTLQQFNWQVPWQFYAVLNGQWIQIQKFLLKELPAVPLESRQGLTNDLSTGDWQQLLRNQLAVNSMLAMFPADQQRLAQVTNDQIDQLSQSFVTNGQINWTQVAAIFQPLPTANTLASDDLTQQWQSDLSRLSAADFVS